MRILFNSRKYDAIAGGVERMSIEMMNEMARRGHEIALTSFDPQTAKTFYPLSADVNWNRISIGDPARKATKTERLKRFFKIRKVVSEFNPHVAIGFQHGGFVTLAAATIGKDLPIIGAERNAPHRFQHLKDGHGRNFQYQSYRLARFVTVQFESYREHYPKHLHRKIVSIPNPVRTSQFLADPVGADRPRKTLLCIARLSYQKNQSALIKAFELVAEEHPTWDLVFVGDGEDWPKLSHMVSESAFAERIELAGAQSQVSDYYRSAHILCLPSRWEGFPNVLAEAMTYGLPCVGFADCAGVNSLISHENTGFLASPSGDHFALAKTLRLLMKSPQLRVDIGNQAKDAISKYEPGAVFDEWEQLFDRASKKGRN